MTDTREKSLEEMLEEALDYARMCREIKVFTGGEQEDPYKIAADYLIANGVTIEQPIDLSGKCGSCVFSKRVSGVFGNAKCYVRCTNEEHLRTHCKSVSSELRQRTHKACKHYVPLPEPPKEATP